MWDGNSITSFEHFVFFSDQHLVKLRFLFFCQRRIGFFLVLVTSALFWIFEKNKKQKVKLNSTMQYSCVASMWLHNVIPTTTSSNWLKVLK